MKATAASHRLHLREARKAADHTLKDAARALGISESYLSLIERGKRPVFVSLAGAMATLYGVPVTALFDELKTEDVQEKEVQHEQTG